MKFSCEYAGSEEGLVCLKTGLVFVDCKSHYLSLEPCLGYMMSNALDKLHFY